MVRQVRRSWWDHREILLRSLWDVLTGVNALNCTWDQRTIQQALRHQEIGGYDDQLSLDPVWALGLSLCGPGCVATSFVMLLRWRGVSQNIRSSGYQLLSQAIIAHPQTSNCRQQESLKLDQSSSFLDWSCFEDHPPPSALVKIVSHQTRLLTFTRFRCWNWLRLQMIH